jgi:glycine hydroxymethyltransferase
MHIVAAKAICFGEALKDEFRDYAQSVLDNAKALADTLAAGNLTLVSGGTDNHLLLVDVTSFNIGGRLAEEVLGRCAITVNKNMIPFDERKPMDPSGIRVGTPALTTRGMGTVEMRQIGDWILQALQSPDDKGLHETINQSVSRMCEGFPVPADSIEALQAG